MLQFFYNQDEFIAAIQYTAGRSGFTSTLIEKDYLCSLLLMYLYNTNTPLIFKGGTLLAKSHANFYRLSEDLDFAISTLSNITRKQRSQQIQSVKNELNNIHNFLPVFNISRPLTGCNGSRQYTMTLTYKSKITQLDDKILIDIGMKEGLLFPSEKIKAKTLLMDPFLGQDKVQPFMIIGLNLQEAYAEKIRAALCRKELAIRDFYDLDYAIENNLIELNDAFLVLIKQKIRYEKFFHDFNRPEVVKFLQEKVQAELEPTLKQTRDIAFSLSRIVEKLLQLLRNI